MIHQIREHDINIPSESSSSSIALTKKTPNRVSKQPIIARHRNARFWDCTAQERPINAKDTAVTAPKQKGKTFIIESTVQRWSPRLTVSILSLGPWQLQLYDTYDIFHVCPLFSPHPWFSSNLKLLMEVFKPSNLAVGSSASHFSSYLIHFIDQIALVPY